MREKNLRAPDWTDEDEDEDEAAGGQAHVGQTS